MQVGVDNSAVLLYTDTTSTTPFDYVVSNNTVYFSNGHVAKKWDPVNGVSNWGIAIGSVSAIGPNTAGNGTSTGTGPAWTNPNNVTSATNFATVSTVPGTASQNLTATQFGFSVTAGFAVSGIQVSFDASCSDYPSGGLGIFLVKGGNVVGTSKGIFPNSAVTTETLGGASDLWGTSWTANDINQTNFGVLIQANDGFHNANWQIRHVQISVFAGGGPAISVSGSAGSLSTTVGWQYVYTYGNSATGHISSPSAPSVSTGVFTSKASVSVTLTASTDPQVNQIHVYRSTDSVAAGTTAQNYFELPNSPFANSSGAITDTATDANLIAASVAPTPGFNDPPTPGQQPVYFSGRVWMFSGTKVYFSGLEEINVGVPEESFPSGIAGNFWSFDQTVQGLAVAGSGTDQTLIPFCGGRVFGLTGNSLDTFRRFLISSRRGCRQLKTVTSMGGMVAWLDSANQIWSTDGVNMQELSEQIRPDIAGVTPANCSMTFHAAGTQHWLVFSTGAKLFVLDLDREVWMPPWTHSTQYVYSGETAPGSYQLISCTATKALQLSASQHNDNGTLYQAIGRTNLFSVVPDFSNRFGGGMMSLYDEPSRTGYPTEFQLNTGGQQLTDMAYLADEDPTRSNVTYTSILANLKGPDIVHNRSASAQYIQQNCFRMTSPTCRWISFQFKSAVLDDAFRVHSFYLSYKEYGLT